MNGYRSRTSTHGRNMAGARALWRATGMKDADFEKPIVAIANSFTQFVPGHVHLHDVGQRAKKVIDAHGGWGVEFNTIAVDDELAVIERSACPTCGSCSGMFTANSMNCLNEAFGLALPGNGTLLATHAKRWELFEEASRRIVELSKRYYVEGDASVLPRSVA